MKIVVGFRFTDGGFTKEIDQASPLMYLALKDGEPVTVTLKWYRQVGAIEEHYFTTVLEDARIVEIKEYFPTTYDKPTAEYPHMEQVKFTYRKIIWTHEVEGKQSEDDWRAPAV